MTGSGTLGCRVSVSVLNSVPSPTRINCPIQHVRLILGSTVVIRRAGLESSNCHSWLVDHGQRYAIFGRPPFPGLYNEDSTVIC